MNKVLILGVSAVQMDAVLELMKMGQEVYTCSRAKDGPAADVADHYEILDFMDKEKLESFIIEKGIDCVYSVGSDIAMPVSAYISEKLALPLFVSEKTALICNNKNLLREFLGNEFKGNIKYQIIKSADDVINIEYPFIIKPADSQGQRGVKLVKSFDDFIEQYQISKSYSRSGLVIIEEYVAGPEFSVNVYLNEGRVVFCIASDREIWPEFDGGLIRKHIIPSRILSHQSNELIFDLVERSVEKLGINNGPVYFQLKMCGDEPKIIEITPRLDGCHMWKVLEYYTGVNLLRLTFEHLLSGKTDELNNYCNRQKEIVLEFLCQEPNTKADYTKFNIPENAVEQFFYYKDDDNIRAVNGRYEKIGYFITEDDV